jgi:hypothetical protein
VGVARLQSLVLAAVAVLAVGCSLLQIADVDRGQREGSELVGEGVVDGAAWRVTFDVTGQGHCLYIVFPDGEGGSNGCGPLPPVREPLLKTSKSGTEQLDVYYGLTTPGVDLVRITTLEGVLEAVPVALRQTGEARAYAVGSQAFSRLVSIEALSAGELLMTVEGPY